MNSILIAGMSAAALSATPLPNDMSHQIRVEHRGRALQASYDGDVTIRHKQVGTASALGRQSVRRCDWTGTVTVTRRLDGSDGTPSAASQVSSQPLLRGSRPGDCVGLRQVIQREAAAQRPKVQAHIAAVAERDRTTLLAQLGTLDRLASD